MMIVGVGLAAFAIGFAITAISFIRSRPPAEVVTVPDVREMDVAAAGRTLDRSDLTLLVGDSFPNPTIPAGAILAQSPLPGQEVGPGAEIRVIVSTGARRPTIPRVEAMPAALATRALQTAGFDVLVEEVQGEGQEGRVIGTDPPSGSAVPLPATVRLRVGGGAIPIEMPTLIGMLEGEARGVAESYGLLVEDVDYEMTPFGEVGGVVGQEPAPGDSIRPGSGVRIRVTGAPRQEEIEIVPQATEEAVPPLDQERDSRRRGR